LGIAAVVAILITFVFKLTEIALGVVVGYMLGNILYTFVIVIFPTINAHIIFYGSVGVCIAVVILLLYLVMNYIEVIVSSLVGGYIFVRVDYTYLI
jgi:hypothetical protein